MGKSALLAYASEEAASWRVANAVGVESEMEMAYSGLHQLCGPMLDQLDALPVPQREALATVFGLGTGTPPDRFLVGLAVLTLLAGAAEVEPVLCVIDDAHWLDHASEQVLAFVARRLLAERVAMVCATRIGIGDKVLDGLPALAVGGLSERDSRALLLANVYGPLDTAVCDQIVTESHGNPLALLELPRTWSTNKLGGGFGLPSRTGVRNMVEGSYIHRLRRLPSAAQQLLLIAAAEPVGDPVLLRRAAAALAIEPSEADAAEDAGLIRIDTHVEFAHPLVRSAVYGSAAAEARRRAHEALADATDPETDPDRRAWHRARAARGPNEEVALELERSASRAQARGGMAAAAVFLEQATALSVAPEQRAERALRAAQLKYEAGSLEDAETLIVAAERAGLDLLQEGRALMLRARVGFVARRTAEDLPRLIETARRIQSIDPDLARTAYMDVFHVALHGGRLDPDPLFEVSAATLECPAESGPQPPQHLLLEGLATRITRGYAAGAPILKTALSGFDGDAARPSRNAACLPFRVALDLWDDVLYAKFVDRELNHAQEAGALMVMPRILDNRSVAQVVTGQLALAATTIVEMRSASDAIGSATHSDGALLLAALRGDESQAAPLIERTMNHALECGEGLDLAYADYAAAILNNGLGRYDLAVAAARGALDRPYEIGATGQLLAELVEAGSRSGDGDLARTALGTLMEMTCASATGWALGVAARSRALLSDDAEAEPLYVEAIERLGSTAVRPEFARARLVYGEWLRRRGRRLDARTQLREAHEMLATTGMGAFAERARRELLATGEKARRRVDATRDQLTAQEEQIARLARDGSTNQDIGAMLYLSPRTVEWHLRKVFAKLGVKSRSELRTAIPTAK